MAAAAVASMSTIAAARGCCVGLLLLLLLHRGVWVRAAAATGGLAGPARCGNGLVQRLTRTARPRALARHTLQSDLSKDDTMCR